MFDAITYYWSTQDPYGNPQSFNQIKEMGDKVHAAGKRWFAPLNPGYETAQASSFSRETGSPSFANSPSHKVRGRSADRRSGAAAPVGRPIT